jgi:hypothetical protein
MAAASSAAELGRAAWHRARRTPPLRVLQLLLAAAAAAALLAAAAKGGARLHRRWRCSGPPRGDPQEDAEGYTAPFYPRPTAYQDSAPLARPPDACAAALGLPQVALLFLTKGDILHEALWREWFQAAAGQLPEGSVRRAACTGGGKWRGAAAERALAACAPDPADADPLRGQHLYDVWVHPHPNFTGECSGAPPWVCRARGRSARSRLGRSARAAGALPARARACGRQRLCPRPPPPPPALSTSLLLVHFFTPPHTPHPTPPPPGAQASPPAACLPAASCRPPSACIPSGARTPWWTPPAPCWPPPSPTRAPPSSCSSRRATRRSTRRWRCTASSPASAPRASTPATPRGGTSTTGSGGGRTPRRRACRATCSARAGSGWRWRARTLSWRSLTWTWTPCSAPPAASAGTAGGAPTASATPTSITCPPCWPGTAATTRATAPASSQVRAQTKSCLAYRCLPRALSPFFSSSFFSPAARARISLSNGWRPLHVVP